MEYGLLRERSERAEVPLLDLVHNVALRRAVTACESASGQNQADMLRAMEAKFLPEGYETRNAYVIAMAYCPDSLDYRNEASGPESLSGAQLKGFVLAESGNAERVFFEFEHHEPGDEFGPDGKTSRYLVPVDSEDIIAMGFEDERLPEPDPSTFQERLEHFIDSCDEALTEEEFSSLSPTERAQLLQLLVLDARLLLAGTEGHLGGAVSLICDSLYVVWEGQSLKNIENDIIKPRKESELFNLSGSKCKVFYPELDIYPHRAFNSLADFSIGNGLPCVSVRSQDNHFSFWVPLSAVRSFQPPIIEPS